MEGQAPPTPLSQRIKAAFSGDDSNENPKLRPPPILGVLFCLISLFCFTCIMTSFNLGPVTLMLCLGLMVMYAAIGTGEGSAWERGYPSTVFLVPLGIGTGLLGLYIGVKIYVNIYSPYYLAVSGRNYQKVPPSARSAEYADAGIIKFTDEAALDTSRSFGYKGDDFTYCVAPVVSRTESVHPKSSGPKVAFWAVGKDCCGNRRDFECDGAGETEVRNAFALKDLEKDALTKLLVPRSVRPQYLKAVRAAEALHNMQSENPENILLVRWAADPEQILEVWYTRAKVTVAIACVIYAVLVTLVWTGIHLIFDADIHKTVGKRLFAGGGPAGGAAAGGSARRTRDIFMTGP